jgi:hypothetical protein
MSVDLRWAPSELSWSSDMVRFFDAAAGLEYLRPFKADLHAMARLRLRLVESGHGGDVSQLADDQVLEVTAAHIASGRMWLWRQPPKFAYLTGQEEAPPPAPSEPPPREKGRESPAGPEPEQPTFGPVDPADQAQTLRNAALLGAPFCEECARRAGAA